MISTSTSFLSKSFATKITNAKPNASVLHFVLSLSSIPSSSSSSSSSEIPSRLHHKDWLAPKEVLQVFSSLTNPNSIVPALNHYSKRKDYKPNEPLLTLIINNLAEARLFDDVEVVVARIKAERNCNLSDDFFRNVIRVYGNLAGRIKRAIEILFEMPEFYGCWPTAKTFNSVLNLLVSARLFDVVHELFVAAPKLGVVIDACCLNIMIKGLCECRKLEVALQMLDEFPRQGCEPNLLTFTTLMHYLCVHGKVEEAIKLFERMEEEGIEPDTITFNVLIAGLRRQGRVDEGMVLLQRMKLKGCNPNVGSYQEVFNGLLDAERFSEANEVMSRIISMGSSPSIKSFKCLIHGLCEENRMEDIDWALKQMGKQGFVPKMWMWKEILQSLFGGKTSDKCVSYFEQVKAN
ncbi:hypothetical protein L484_020794 [Morus notabilis]|uniref:Pentatricopeptide repeat-containing protein n=1 Tax=Morus notabilis TaxID=981085 RepID=W9S356_9ROSA|nr:pentatricopeptide repeat-containing protein At3g14580, mitochondrial [Morus notabilis]EXC11739.1 hypothetical protein L484_020794 [Morus notabilis]